MRVLTVVHQDDAGPGVFADAAAAAGAELVEWRASAAPLPPGPFDAALAFGGSAHPDQDEAHGWIPEEVELLGRLARDGVPVLGVCLGAELLARALGAEVGPIERPEIGWHEVELLPEAAADPVLGGLASPLTALQWHSYGFGLPEGAVALARSPASLQAFRWGERAWALQFHPEVTEEIVRAWAREEPAEAVLERTPAEIGRWNEVGRAICRAFLGVT